MKHLILPKYSDGADSEKWGLNENSFVHSVLIQNTGGRIIFFSAQSDQTNTYGCPEGNDFILIGNTIKNTFFLGGKFWVNVFGEIIKHPESWCIWWHAGGSGILNKTSANIKIKWSSDFVDKLPDSIFNNKLKLCIKKIQPYLYSEGGKSEKWSDVIKGPVRSVFSEIRTESGTISKNYSGIIDNMNKVAIDAKRRYVGLEPLKNDLSKLMPFYVKILEHIDAQSHNESKPPDVDYTIVTELFSNESPPVWFEGIYQDLNIAESIRLQKKIPLKQEISESLCWLQAVASNGSFQDSDFGNLHLIQRLFQLLNTETIEGHDV